MARFRCRDARIRSSVAMTKCPQPFPRLRGPRSFFAPVSSLLVVAMEQPFLLLAPRSRRKALRDHPRSPHETSGLSEMRDRACVKMAKHSDTPLALKSTLTDGSAPPHGLGSPKLAGANSQSVR